MDSAPRSLRLSGSFLLVALLALAPSPGFAASQLPKAAGPRLGTVYEVTVELGDRAALSRLSDFDVTGLRGTRATVSATAEEVEALRGAGFELVEVKKHEKHPLGEKTPTGWNWDVFHDYAQVTAFVQDLASRYPSLVRVQSIGRSVQNRDIWAVKISDNPAVEEAEPEVRFVANIHGDEVVGVEMVLRFMDQLVSYYPKSRRVHALIDDTELWFVPMWNPDGHQAADRYNANGYDLNRVFPDESIITPSNLLLGPARDLSELDSQTPEVSAFMRFSQQHRFVTGASFHGGAVVAVYPWSTSPDGESVFTPTPDNGLYVALCKAFASRNLPMHQSAEFPEGIYNSAEWYTVNGCSQDWAYKVTGMFDLDIELSEIKWPSASTIDAFWAANQPAMLALAETARWGVHGVVTDAVTGHPVGASIKVEGYDHLTFSEPTVGDFHRPLLAGTYTLLVSAPGYATREIPNVVVRSVAPTTVDVALQPATSVTAYKIDFRPNDGVTLNGYLVDRGQTFGPRGNGLSYGWDAAPCLQARSHLFSQDASFDSFADMQGCSGRVWEIALPNGNYWVHLVAGDASAATNGTVRLEAEGQVFAGAMTSASRWVEGSVLATVSDGRLTIRSGQGATRNKLCSIEIVQQAARSDAGVPSKLERIKAPAVKLRGEGPLRAR